jgi:hypothetical protein
MPTRPATLVPTSTDVDVLAALTAMQAQLDLVLTTLQRHQTRLDRLLRDEPR